MNDASELFKRQAAWQKSLRHLPWPEKIRLIARLRDQVKEIRRSKSRRRA
jgi:hypothetical protein